MGRLRMQKLAAFKAGPLPELAPMFRRWIRANLVYVDQCEDTDAPWWFNERAALSTVAAASWLAGGIALEEYTAPKVPPGANPRALSNRSRCDLFLSFKRSARRGDNHNFITEAKIIWPKLDSPKLAQLVAQGVDKVRRDTRRTLNDGYSRRLGILLISPWLDRAAMDEWRGHALGFVKVLRSLEGVAIAWVFAPNPWKLLWRGRREYYPGSALVITPLRR
jgi:hypothetical protein